MRTTSLRVLLSITTFLTVDLVNASSASAPIAERLPSTCWHKLKAPAGSPSRFFLNAVKSLGRNTPSVNESGHERWPTDGYRSGPNLPDSYDTFFSQALGGRKIDELAEIQRMQGMPFHVADYFGSAVFSLHPELYSSLTGVRFAPLMHEALPAEYPNDRWAEVIGDIYQQKTWASLDQNMASRQIPDFNLAIVRPLAPLFAQTHNISRINSMWGQNTGEHVFFRLNGNFLRRVWQRLNKEKGIILIELQPQLIELPTFKIWLSLLQAKNIQAEVFSARIGKPGGHVLKLAATPNSPTELPLL